MAAGPGFTTTFVGSVDGITIDVDSARLPDGREFSAGGVFGYAPNPRTGGATEGYAPDGRELPEWVDFVWTERPYGIEHTLEELRAMPRKTQRVFIRSRIPRDVVEEVLAANRRCKKGQLPDTDLSVYFVWSAQDIKFHWILEKRNERGTFDDVRSGGDDVMPK